MTASTPYPQNPPLVHITRGGIVESQHRGAWVVVSDRGDVIAGAGEIDAPFYARSTIKALQVLPLFESGAVDEYAVSDIELALACASHNAEEQHTQPVESFLQRTGHSVGDLQCGTQSPGDAERRVAMHQAGEDPSALHNNCSGKHAGFLALSKHVGDAPKDYLDPECRGQVLVRDAIARLCDLEVSELKPGIDGCSAPTYPLPLRALGIAFARIATPERLGASIREFYERILAAVAEHPALIAGEHRRICTQISRVTRGRLFPKIGAEAIYAVGERGTGRALALKLDDGGRRGLHPLLVELLHRFEFLTDEEFAALARWREAELNNWSGKLVGSIEVLV